MGSTSSIFLIVLSLAGCLCLSSLLGQETLKRVWTSSDGKTVEMELIDADRTKGTFLVGSKRIDLPLDRLAAADQAIVREWLASIPVSREWPEVVEVKSDDIEIEEKGEEDGFHLYQTEHFLFRSQEKLGISLMREVARVFEASHALLSAMPWAMTPQAPGAPTAEGKPSPLFHAELYRNRSSYMAAGGPQLSGGVYTFGYSGAAHYGKFMVPFESIGVKQVGKSFMKDGDFTADTLIHELCHQLMHFSLFLIPRWTSEGAAEYCESIPYKVGRFRAEAIKGGVKDYIEDRRGEPRLPADVVAFLKMDDETWANNSRTSDAMGVLYYQSLLCFYFFAHLEGDETGENLLGYFDKVNQAQKKWADFASAYRHYREDLDLFLAQPEVKQLPDGRFTFPDGMTPPPSPENPFPDGVEGLSIELVDELIDGRSTEDLREEMVEGFRKVGIRVR